MRAVLIDPWKRAVTEIDRKEGDEIAPLLEACNGFDNGLCFVALTRTDQLVIDDMGLLREGVPVFRLHGYPHPLAGAAMILGYGERGETTDTTLTRGDLTSVIEWTDRETTGKLTPTVKEGNAVRLGDAILRVRMEPRF